MIGSYVNGYHGKSMPIQTTSSKISDTYGFNISERLEKFEFGDHATYVIDSNESLMNWATNNKKYNYTRVLVKSGTWTIDRNINLTETKTEKIVGETNATILMDLSSSAEKTIYGLYYKDERKIYDNDCKIENLTISVKYDNDNAEDIIGLYGASHIKNVNIIMTINGSSIKDIIGLDNCNRLNKCNVNCTVNNPYSDIYQCMGYSNCITGENLAVNLNGNGKLIGASNCNYIQFVSFTHNETKKAIVLSGCKHVII